MEQELRNAIVMLIGGYLYDIHIDEEIDGVKHKWKIEKIPEILGELREYYSKEIKKM